MTDEQLKKYHEKRNAIIKEYRNKSLKIIGLAVGIGGGLIAAILIVFILLLENAPVGIVLSLVVGLFTLLMSWMKVIAYNTAKQKKLHEFEDQSLLNKF